MIKYILLMWLAVYIWSIISSFFELIEITKSIDILDKYVSSASFTEKYQSLKIVKKENYNDCLRDALRKYPVIEKYAGYMNAPLEYGASDEKNMSSAVKLLNKLSMTHNYQIEYFKSSLNPTKSLKILFGMPSSILRWLGIANLKNNKTLVNFLTWSALYCSGLYDQEIKILINLIIKKLS